MKSLQRLLRPEIAVPAVYLLFLLFAALSYEMQNTSQFLLKPRGAFDKPALLSYAVSLLAIIFLVIAIKIGERIDPRKIFAALPFLIFFAAALALYLTFPMPLVLILGIPAGYAALLWFISRRMEEVRLIVAAAILLALAASLTILIKGIPILESEARLSTAVTPSRALFHGFATFSAVLLAAFFERKKAAVTISLLAILGIISGFKSDAIAILASAAIAAVLLEKISAEEILGAGLGVVLILTAMSTYIAKVAYGGWKILPALYVFYRAGFTFAVFDGTVQLGFPFGYLRGEALLSTTQEVASVAVLGYAQPHIITTTLIGPGMLDFGLLGIALICLLVGMYLGIMHRLAVAPLQTCLYAIALTHTFLLIEVGLQLSSVIFYLSLLFLSLAGEKK